MRVIDPRFAVTFCNLPAGAALEVIGRVVLEDTSLRGAVIMDDRTMSLYYGAAPCSPVSTECRLDTVFAYVNAVGIRPISSDRGTGHDSDRMQTMLLPYTGIYPATYFHIDQNGNVKITALVTETNPIGVDTL